jgi:hypothetical protein
MLDFHEDLFKAKHGVQILRGALKGQGISKVLQFPESRLIVKSTFQCNGPGDV